MNKFLTLAIAALVALSIWACVDNANKPANTNTSANSNANATAAKAAPALDTLMAQEKAANEAYMKGDGQFFENLLSDKFAMNNMGVKSSKADAVKMISQVKCDVKSVNVDDGKLSKIDDDTYAVVYKITGDGSCTYEGKKEAMSPTRSGTVWIRSGDKWQPIWHGETPIVEQKEPGAANANTADKKEAAKPPAKADEKKAPEKPAANTNAGASSNSNSAAPAADPNVDAMVAVEKSGWEAWKARDSKKLEDITEKDLSFVDLMGNVTPNQADTIKLWMTGQCDIKSTTISDTSGQTISPTLGMIMFKGSADGTCDGQKIMPLYGTSFYKKEGDSWKLAFGFESLAM
jgi:hypothetical protein